MSDSTISIGGVSVDINDPCAVLTQLRKAEVMVSVGESVSMARFGEDETRFTDANLKGLRELIVRYEGLCDRKNGKRRRHAMRPQFG